MNGELIFDDSQAGFRLGTLQIYNWGVLQNNKIFTFDFSNKSTLLTGRNGSGKTTIVDAIITLLVPKRYRLYNQSSSGDLKDKDRDEESYVLGAYGNASDESSVSGKTKYLRDKNCFSIINGIFNNEITGQAVSLIQIRYFSNNALLTYSGVTEQALLISDIKKILAEADTKIDREKKWRQVLKVQCGTEFWDSDNFSKYCSKFKSIFGLHEDKENKALKLFAQIVGMKELGNLNDFIRQKMIEGVDVETEFENLHDNYEKLIQCENEIEKTKCQLELLKPVIDTGKNIIDTENQRDELLAVQETIPAWYSKTAIGILAKEINHKETEKQNLEETNEQIKEQIENLSAEISMLENNNDVQLLNEKERLISDYEGMKKDVEQKRDSFEENAKKLKLGIPENREDFESFLSDLQDLKDSFENKKKENDDFKVDASIEKKELEEEEKNLETELKSLGSRNSNIPLRNIEIRKFITSNLNMSEKDIPFAGELIQVKQEEKHWEYAIERLLHNLALTLLVTPEHYEKVTEFIKDNDLKGRVVYLMTEMHFGDFLIEPEDCTVLSKIEINHNHELGSWLERHIYDKWNYICTDKNEIVFRNDKVITSSGLIKNGIKGEKDDSEKAKSHTEYVLGWDNLEKRKTLSSKIEKLREEKINVSNRLQEIDDLKDELEAKIECVKELQRFNSFSNIDVESLIIKIQALIEERNRFIKEKGISDIEKQLLEKKRTRKELTEQKDNLLTKIGAVDKEIEINQTKFDENEQAWKTIISSVNENEVEEKIQTLINKFEIKVIESIEKLSAKRNDINKRIELDVKRFNKSHAAYVKNLGDYMRNIKSPKDEYKKRYGDWSIQFADLIEGREYLEAWNDCYKRLTEEELPKHQKQFKVYLHSNMNDNIIKFNQFIINGKQEIQKAIVTLNASLKEIPYDKEQNTYLQLKMIDNKDQRIIEFNRMLRNAIPNAAGYQNDEEEEKAFRRIKDFIDYVKANERNQKYVLDIRNWHSFAAPELSYEDGSEKDYHSDSNSLSGGEKAKLTYTILASAIAYQFGINESSSKSLRFVIVDEVFSKSDSFNAQYAMQLFKQLDLQVMIVTPLDKLNVAEEYISSVHQVQKIGDSSRVLSLTMEWFKEKRAELEAAEHD